MALWYKVQDPSTTFNYDDYAASGSESAASEPELHVGIKEQFQFGCKFVDPWIRRLNPTMNLAASRILGEIRKLLTVESRYLESNCDLHLQIKFKLCGYDMEYEQRTNCEMHPIWDTSTGEFVEMPRIHARLTADEGLPIFEHRVYFDRGLEETVRADQKSVNMLFGSDHVAMIGSKNLWRLLGLICYEEQTAWTQKYLPFHLHDLNDVLCEDLD